MSLNSNIVEVLTNTTNVNNWCAGRIYQDERPQINSNLNGLPCIVLNTVSTVPTNTKTGPSQVDIIRVQFDVYATDKDSTNTGAELLRAALDYTGTDSEPFTNPTELATWGSCVYEEERDMEYIYDSGTQGTYNRSIDFIIRKPNV